MSWKQIERRIKGKMKVRGVDPDATAGFLRMVKRVHDNRGAHEGLESVKTPDTGLLLNPPVSREEWQNLHKHGCRFLSRVAVIKLNGGRSTTMGGLVPKGILRAKDGYTYLEIIARQMKALWEQYGVNIPLVLMNSFFTHRQTMELMNRLRFPVLTFMQNQVPRLVEDSLEPLDTGTEEDWVPPGHGDIYGSLQRSGILDHLLGRGCRWALISNLDNLAATVEPWIVGLLHRDNIDFLLEVTDRTAADRKGGTLVARDGRLELLEIAQVPAEERHLFMDVDRFRVFNTNNVWVDLEALAQALEAGTLELPIIRNRKLVAGTLVVQLETAMGAAMGSFPRARGLRVGRDRFFPTKQIGDLFVLQSDACVLDPLYRVLRNPMRPGMLPYRPTVTFSEDFLDSPLDLHDCFADPASVSLLETDTLRVSGPVFFEREVRVVGRVSIEVPAGRVYLVRRGTVLEEGKYP
jgi:UTP--glucose-1-phosphate uridylyltransferase